MFPKGIVTEEEVEAFLRMANKQRLGHQGSHPGFSSSQVSKSASSIIKKSSDSSSSSGSSSSNSSDEGDRGSYRSEITIDFGNKQSNSTEETIKTSVVILKQGYILSNIDEVRHLKTGETMSIYEAKLRGIATDAKTGLETTPSQIKVFVDEAVSRGLISFNRGTFTNPTSGEEIPISEAIKVCFVCLFVLNRRPGETN